MERRRIGGEIGARGGQRGGLGRDTKICYPASVSCLCVRDKNPCVNEISHHKRTTAFIIKRTVDGVFIEQDSMARLAGLFSYPARPIGVDR